VFRYKPYDTSAEDANGLDNSIKFSGPTGFSFTTNITGSLHDIALDLADSNPQDGGTVTVSLYSDSGGQPGQSLDLLGTIRDSSLGQGTTLVDLPAPIGVDLTAGTEYWIVVKASAGSQAIWLLENNDDAGYGAFGQSYVDDGHVHSDTGGAYIATVNESVQGSLSADYDTTGQTVGGSDPAIQHGGLAGFSFSNASAGTLNQVGLYLADLTPTDGGTVTVSLFSDDGGHPGQSIATLGVIDDASLTNDPNGAAILVHLQAPSGLQLTAGTEYWIVASGSATSKAVWIIESSDAGTGASGQSFDDNGRIISNTQGAYIADVEVYSACYCAGTLIRTGRGEASVETLKIGDEVMTASGALRPIKWIGRRSYGRRFIMGRKDILPVCIKAGALADNVPARDLWISPHHAMFFADDRGGVLIEAKDLVNGSSIVQAQNADKVEYFHIELDSHDVIIAEGAWSETFIDDDSRGMFHNADDYDALYGNEERALVRYCAPRLDEGHEVEAVRRRLAARAVPEQSKEVDRVLARAKVTVHRRAPRVVAA
jgi:Hint domain